MSLWMFGEVFLYVNYTSYSASMWYSACLVDEFSLLFILDWPHIHGMDLTSTSVRIIIIILSYIH